MLGSRRAAPATLEGCFSPPPSSKAHREGRWSAGASREKTGNGTGRNTGKKNIKTPYVMDETGRQPANTSRTEYYTRNVIRSGLTPPSGEFTIVVTSFKGPTGEQLHPRRPGSSK